MFQSEVLEKIKYLFVVHFFFFLESRAIYEIGENYGRGGQTRDDTIIRGLPIK
jgi:hypothetical protein